jgi:hypothetical protein
LKLIYILDICPMMKFRSLPITDQQRKLREVPRTAMRLAASPSHSVGNMAVTAARSPHAATSVATNEKSPHRHLNSAAQNVELSLHV